MRFLVEVEREDDGRWLAEVQGLPGAMAYFSDAEHAVFRATAVALRILADRIEAGELDVPATRFEFTRAA